MDVHNLKNKWTERQYAEVKEEDKQDKHTEEEVIRKRKRVRARRREGESAQES